MIYVISILKKRCTPFPVYASVWKSKIFFIQISKCIYIDLFLVSNVFFYNLQFLIELILIIKSSKVEFFFMKFFLFTFIFPCYFLRTKKPKSNIKIILHSLLCVVLQSIVTFSYFYYLKKALKSRNPGYISKRVNFCRYPWSIYFYKKINQMKISHKFNISTYLKLCKVLLVSWWNDIFCK